MQIKYKRSYRVSFGKLNLKIKAKVIERLEIFIKSPFDKILNNHALKWTKKWLRTINITGDYRLVFRELSNGSYELVELLDVGSHAKLYW